MSTAFNYHYISASVA